MWCVEAGQEGAERHRVATGATSHTDRMRGEGGRHRVGSRKSKVRGHRGGEGGGPGAMQEGSRDDATTPQNHNHNAAPNRRRQEGAGVK